MASFPSFHHTGHPRSRRRPSLLHRMLGSPRMVMMSSSRNERLTLAWLKEPLTNLEIKLGCSLERLCLLRRARATAREESPAGGKSAFQLKANENFPKNGGLCLSGGFLGLFFLLPSRGFLGSPVVFWFWLLFQLAFSSLGAPAIFIPGSQGSRSAPITQGFEERVGRVERGCVFDGLLFYFVVLIIF